MSADRVNASKRFLWEAAEQNAEEEVDSRMSEGSSSSSSDGSNQPHQNENSVISSNSCPASSSMRPRASAIANASNPQLHQQSAMSLLSSPVSGTLQSIMAPAMTETFHPFQHGQDINQFLLSQHMSMVSAGTLQVPVNQPGPRSMKNPLRAAVNSYYYPTSNITADYRLDSSPRPQMGIGATVPPFIQAHMCQRQHYFRQTANNPGSRPFRPQHGHLQASVTQAKGYTCGGPRHQMLLNMAIPQELQSIYSPLLASNCSSKLMKPPAEPIFPDLSNGHGSMHDILIAQVSCLVPSPGKSHYLLGYARTCRLGLMRGLKYKQEMQGSNGRALMLSEVGESSARGRKRKVVFQDEPPSPSHPEQLLNWFPQGLDNQRLELSGQTTSTPRYNISLYAPAFQTMGLPVDPHLRMFLAMNERMLHRSRKSEQ